MTNDDFGFSRQQLELSANVVRTVSVPEGRLWSCFLWSLWQRIFNKYIESSSNIVIK